MATGGGSYRSLASANDRRVDHDDHPILECRVCQDVFCLQGDKVPRLLFCGHTVCHWCLTQIQQNGRSVLCPFDRQPTAIGDSGVWGLKKNFALLELLERIQFSGNRSRLRSVFSEEGLMQEKKLAIPCDEKSHHIAVLYCTICSTNLCLSCSETTHSTRTLSRHKRVPLSEKPKEIPKCPYHPQHFVEFVCLEDGCQTAALMCYICKDYGRHTEHAKTLLETEAENVRASILSAVHQIKSFAEEVAASAQKLSTVIQRTEGSLHVTHQGNATTETHEIPGTATDARTKVRQYFNELRTTLDCQEMAAMAVVDTHIREKLCMCRQQQEDMSILLAQISAVCQQCEATLKEDDCRVLLARQDVKQLVETIHKQQHQFSDLPEQLMLDPSIPITFTKDNRVHIGPKMEMRVVTLGLDDSGKTTILFKLAQDEFIQAIPTLGFNVEMIEYKNLKFTIWDVGGQDKLRPLWKHYYLNTQAVIFVVDSSNKDRLSEAYNELAKLLQEKELKDASLLLLANKQDVRPCATIEEITLQFNLFKLCCNRSWHIQACDARTGYGLQDGLEWLSRQMVATASPELV